MKRKAYIIIAAVVLLAVAGGEPLDELPETVEVHWGLIPMVMVDDEMYYDTGRVSTAEGRCGVLDGEITSSVEGWEKPTQNDQSNFGSGYGYQYGAENTIEVNIDGKWFIYEKGSGEGKIRFGNRWYDRGYLSEETLEWLEWYYNLPEEEQLKVNAIPAELLEEAVE